MIGFAEHFISWWEHDRLTDRKAWSDSLRKLLGRGGRSRRWSDRPFLAMIYSSGLLLYFLALAMLFILASFATAFSRGGP